MCHVCSHIFHWITHSGCHGRTRAAHSQAAPLLGELISMCRRERLLARVERVQRRLAAAQRAARESSPPRSAREEGTRPHGLRRICSLGSRSVDDALHLPPIDEGSAVFMTPETQDAAPGPRGAPAETLTLPLRSRDPQRGPRARSAERGAERQRAGSGPDLGLGSTHGDTDVGCDRTRLASGLIALALVLLHQDAAHSTPAGTGAV